MVIYLSENIRLVMLMHSEGRKVSLKVVFLCADVYTISGFKPCPGFALVYHPRSNQPF
jgi:hypothetical protein